MTDALLDTSVVIDLARSKPEALAWMATQEQTLFGLPVLVVMEMVQGVQNN